MRDSHLTVDEMSKKELLAANLQKLSEKTIPAKIDGRP
jgi:hypothetical protein